MRFFSVLAVLLLCCSAQVQKTGQWSRRAIALNDLPGKTQSIQSPDSSQSVVFSGNHLKLLNETPEAEGIPIDDLAEVLWAPDSKAIAVTATDGGWIGNWHVDILRVSNGKLSDIEPSYNEITSNVAENFGRRYKCDDFKKTGNEAPNFGAARWIRDSKELLIIAEVPTVSTCPELVLGYVVRVPSGSIVRVLSEKQLRTAWGTDLGWRFAKK